jgi:DNA-binding MltR family transcriptional regulator
MAHIDSSDAQKGVATFDIMHELAPLMKLEDDGELPFLQDGLDDIGVVMQATSLIDRFLRLVLLSGFRSNTISKSLIDKIFEGYGPLSSFSNRIAVCTALGLAGSDVRHDLSIIRNIRNDFAHSYKKLSLSHYQSIKTLKVVTSLPIHDDNLYRLRFKQSCVGIIGSLCNFAIFATAKDRFISKNEEGVKLEFNSLREEAKNL